MLALLWIAACTPGRAVFGPTEEPLGVEPATSTVTNPGTGPATGAYLVRATAAATRDGGATTTTLRVEVADRDGAPFDAGVDVEVEVGGARLDPSDDPGVYEATVSGYDRTYPLRIDGPEGHFQAAAAGPEPHDTVLPPDPWHVTDAIRITWSPAGATFAAVAADGPGRVELATDAGEHVFAPDTLHLGAERIEVERWEVLDLGGAAPGSSFVVSYRTADPVRTDAGDEPGPDDTDPGETDTGEPDGTDPGPGDTGDPPGGIEGELRVDSRWQNEVGTAWVAAWPVGRRPVGGSWTAPEAWIRIDGFQDREDYEITDLAAGDWAVLAYFDLDGSDGAAVEPPGPTPGDPFVEDQLAVSPGATTQAELRMEDPW